MKTAKAKDIKDFGDFFTPDCPYADKCTSKGIRCGSCKHNKKRDYYEPIHPYPIWVTDEQVKNRDG